MNNLNKQISVALAVYNGAKYLPELLASLEAQTYKPKELLVVDDCSADNSLAAIEAFPLSFDKKIFKNRENKGPVYSFKKAGELCSGEYVLFCDQDDIWMPDKIESSFKKMNELKKNVPAVVFTDLSVINEKGKLVQPSFWKQMDIQPEKFSFKDILFDNIITGCTAMINQKMTEELAVMPEDVMMHDHWIALIAYSFGTYTFIDKPTVKYRAHQANVTEKIKASVIDNFVNDYKKEDYLKNNIEQAIKFKNVYASRLTATQLKAIEEFISLGKKNFVVKRLAKYGRRISRRLK